MTATAALERLTDADAAIDRLGSIEPAKPTGRRQRARFALVGFLVGVFLARIVTTVLHIHGAGENGGLIIDGVHIHHAMFGLAILATVTVLWMLEVGVRSIEGVQLWKGTAMAWGFAWALVLDEFALLLHLKDVDWLPSGEESLYALALFAVVLSVIAWRAPE